MRGLLPVWTLAGAAALALGSASAEQSGAPGSFATLEARRAALEDAERRLLALMEDARRDPRTALVETYLSWTRPDDFKSPRRSVRAADLAEILKDDSAPVELRTKVKEALTAITPRSLDPDLSLDDNRRAVFARDKLVPILALRGEKLEASRRIAAEILESYFHYSEPDITRYNPADEGTWSKAVGAYRRRLSSR